LNRPLVNAAALGVPLCDGPLPAAARGAIVLCRRGVNPRVEKGSNVRTSGGAGMILYNPEPADVVSDNHWLPAVHIDTPAANQLLAFLAAHTSQPVTADISGGKAVLDSQSADQIAAFSSRGPLPTEQLGISKPDIAAPGVDVLSALPGGTYGENSGTSMAGPHVAGVVALMWSAQPRLIGNIDRTEQILAETARPYDGVQTACLDAGVPNNGVGYGVVDAYAAVQAALALP
ncbi:hypothetical protein SE17_26790, partial [Kouleothrix aurantiaca]